MADAGFARELIEPHLMGMPDLEWDKVEGGLYYMSRKQYDAGNEQL